MTPTDPLSANEAQDVTGPARKGVFDVRTVRFLSGAAFALALIATSLVCILGIWGQVDRDTVLRMLSTLIVVASLAVSVTVFNETIGPKIDA